LLLFCLGRHAKEKGDTLANSARSSVQALVGARVDDEGVLRPGV
jgi:hypothetical protein